MMASLYPAYLRICLEFAYAIELIWITALLVQYGTPCHIDACIWIIPVLISKVIAARLSTRIALLLVLAGQIITAVSWWVELPLSLENRTGYILTREYHCGNSRFHFGRYRT